MLKMHHFMFLTFYIVHLDKNKKKKKKNKKKKCFINRTKLVNDLAFYGEKKS